MLHFIRNTFLHPLKEIIHDSRAIGIILLCCTFLSLVIANIPSVNIAYTQFWENTFSKTNEHWLHIGFINLPNSILIIINDFLMAFFFFLAGMEIKRELSCGELSSFKKSFLPVFAALGGMLMPALLFLLCNKNSIYKHGWAIPTATDIAFTLGIASLLGKRVPLALKVFITALAIIDDLGAIVIIAIFYGSKLKVLYLVLSAVIVIVFYMLNKLKIKFGLWHILSSLLLWYCMFNSGIHATIAGVIAAFFVPVNNLEKLELKLHSPVYFLILPIFALANTAIIFPENFTTTLTNSLSIGIFIGLFLGKPLGIFIFSFLAVKTKIAALPEHTNFKQMIGAGILCGIGFTMSIFIAALAFKEIEFQNTAKIAVLIASFVSIIFGIIWLRAFSKPVSETEI